MLSSIERVQTGKQEQATLHPLGLGCGAVDEAIFQLWSHLPCSRLFAPTPSWHMNFCISVTNHRSGQGSDPAGFLSFPVFLILELLFSLFPQFRSQHNTTNSCANTTEGVEVTGRLGNTSGWDYWGGKPFLTEERPDRGWQLQGELVHDCLVG